MDERLLRLRVGIVVVVAVIMTVLLVMLFGDLQLPGTRKYTIYVRFPRAPGVAVGTPVRKSGISIGRVSEIDILDDATVRVTADIDADEKVLTSEICKIASSSVLGDPVLEFVLADTNIPGEPLPDGAEIDGIVAGNPLEVIGNLEQDIKGALISIRGAGDEVKMTAQGLRGALNGEEDQLPRILQKTERALDQLNKSLQSVDNVLGDEQLQQNLKRSLEDIPRFFDKANETFDGFQRMSQRAERNLENLERFTKPLSERGPVLVDNIDGILGNVNSLTEQLDELARNFSETDGTIGRLLRDETIYDRLNRSLANVEEITFQLRPIMRDVRIFSDKIARDPRQLGLKGALDKRPLGTGIKQSSFLEPLPNEHEIIEVEEEPPFEFVPPRRPWLGRE